MEEGLTGAGLLSLGEKKRNQGEASGGGEGERASSCPPNLFRWSVIFCEDGKMSPSAQFYESITAIGLKQDKKPTACQSLWRRRE